MEKKKKKKKTSQLPRQEQHMEKKKKTSQLPQQPHMEKKKKKKTSQLPHDLITQILLKLPTKSLVRFKCVCKSWLSLISDHRFASSHFEKLSATTLTRRIIFIPIHANESDETLTIDLESSLKDNDNDDDDSAFAVASTIKLNFLPARSFLEIGGSCSGFLFLHYGGDDFHLWNPSNGVHKHVPCSPFKSNLDSRHFTYLYGFGYDLVTDDYLVVLGSCDPSSVRVSTRFEYFSLRGNTWKEIEGSGTHLPYMNESVNTRAGLLFNGAIHWLAYHPDLSMNVIVVFDLAERRVLEIALPNEFDNDPTFCDLWVLGGREGGGFLSIWSMEGVDGVEIWEMRKYKANSSWTKTLVLTINPTQDSYFYPICSMNCGDIVGTYDDTDLVKWNSKGQLLGHRSYCNGSHESQVAVYTESLLSLPSGSEQA